MGPVSGLTSPSLGWPGRPIRCLVFDFDGVLVDSPAVKRSAYGTIFRSFGPAAAPVVRRAIEDDEADRYQIIGRIIGELMAAGLMPSQPAEPIVAALAAQYNSHCETFASVCPETPGASAALAVLSRRVPLYVNSGTPSDVLRRIVSRRGWTAYFRQVLGSPASKVANLLQIIQAEQVHPGEVLVVGDRRSDLTAAEQAGCRFVGVRREDSDLDDATVLLVADLRELCACVAESTERAGPC